MSPAPFSRFAAFVILLIATATILRADEYDNLRLKWRDIIVGSGYDTSDPDVVSKLNGIANSANSVWASMDRSANRTFLWSDAASTTVAAALTTNYSRLRAMALAYATPGCSLYGNAALLADTISGLDWMNANRYNATSTQYGNWWDWEIGVPLQLTDICVLLYEQLTPTQRSNYMNAVEKQTPVPETTGANLVWKARVVGVRGCIVKSSAKLTLARDAFSDVFPYVTSGDGFYSDGSFIQHNRHPYTAGYGASLLANMAPVLNWLHGSAWAITDPAIANVYRWVFDSYEPVIYRGAAWAFVRGREIARSSDPQSTGHSLMDSVLQIAQFAPAADAARMRSLVKGLAQSDTVRDFVANRGLPTLTLAKQLMADPTVAPRPEPIGHYHFAGMDRVVHLGAGYGFGLSMCSSRIYNFESINGENLRGWFTGDGMAMLYNADLNQYGSGYWATIDAYRLPGVTADPTHNKLPPNPGSVGSSAKTSNTLSAYNWTGGTTLGEFGAAGMQLDGAGVTLTAKKSWFMFDDEIVCLGAGITSTDNRPIETTVENRRLNSAGNNKFIVNGSTKPITAGWSETTSSVNWAHLAGSAPDSDIGYYFPQPATLKCVRETRTGTWADIDEGASATPITNSFLRMTFEHGSNPTNATYQYVVLPGRSSRRVSHYAEAPQVTVLANNGNVQAVTETTLGITGANFWTDSTQTAGIITVDKKSSVMIRNDGTFIDVSVSDPTQTNTGVITVQLAATGTLVSADAGINVTQTSPTISMSVGVNASRGKTLKARFYIGTPGSLSITAEADSYVQDGTANADANYGTSSGLVVKKSGTGFNRETFLRFSVPAFDGVLLGASLQLLPTTAQIPGIHGVVKVDDNTWLESGPGGITWNNKPAASTTLLSTWTPALGTPVSADVTAAVSGPGLHSFKVYATTSTSDGYVSYGSRQSGVAADRPQLVLALGHRPPGISITTPADGEFIARAGPVTITADVQVTDGAVTSVSFYDGNTLLGTSRSAPYTFTANLGGGPHLLTAVATATNGLSRTSLSRRIDIAYPPMAMAANMSTPRDTSIDLDLRKLVSDVETPATQMLFTVASSSNGTVVLLSDGHTARFTPTAGYSGPASFSYTVTDATVDGRTLLNYDFQNSSIVDSTDQGRDGVVNLQGTGAIAYTIDAPPPLSPLHTRSIALTENGTAGGVRIERAVPADELDWRNADWTIAGWFKRVSTANIDSVLQLGDSGGWGNSAMTLVLPGGSTSLELRNYNGSTQDVGIVKSGVTAGVWHHFAIVRSDTVLSLFIDGTLAGSDSSFAFSFDNSKPVKFGGVGATTVLDRWFNGSLADLGIFSAALSAPEVKKLSGLPISHFAGQSAGNSIEVSVLSALDQWRQQQFGTPLNTGLAADDADPNNDGIINKLEFFLSRNPLAQTPSSSLPAIVRNGTALEYIYTRNVQAANELMHVVEWSDTLAAGSWSSAGITEQILSDSGTTQQVRANVPAGSNGRRFIRLRVQ